MIVQIAIQSKDKSIHEPVVQLFPENAAEAFQLGIIAGNLATMGAVHYEQHKGGAPIILEMPLTIFEEKDED